jgi:serine/threonine protein kinase
VGDFGIVRDLGKESLTTSWLTMGPGTPFYAAPEQLNNDKVLIDWRADQFAVGVTLTIAHLGFHPYQADRDDENQAIARAAGRDGPSERFVRAIEKVELPILARMAASWPVQRVRTPAALLAAWRDQKNS